MERRSSVPASPLLFHTGLVGCDAVLNSPAQRKSNGLHTFLLLRAQNLHLDAEGRVVRLEGLDGREGDEQRGQ